MCWLLERAEGQGEDAGLGCVWGTSDEGSMLSASFYRDQFCPGIKKEGRVLGEDKERSYLGGKGGFTGRRREITTLSGVLFLQRASAILANSLHLK